MSIYTVGNDIRLHSIEHMVEEVLREHHVSPVTGFLAEDLLIRLPMSTGNSKQDAFFWDLQALLQDLPRLIREGKVREGVKKRLHKGTFGELSWRVANLLHLSLGMLAHVWLKEAYPYRTVGELMQDGSEKLLCKEIALPLWEVSKITGADPTMSYCFYSLWNGVKVDPNLPFALYNFKLIHSFTGSESEKWFVGIHQVIEVAFAPAIPEYLRAYYLALHGHKPDIVTAMHNALTKAAIASEKCVDVLRAMRAHLDPRAYFESVRLFYMFPRNVIFEGVEELHGKPQNPFGETGGQAIFRHFQEAVLGIYPHDDKYFPAMRRNMQTPFRKLVEGVFNSEVREFVLYERNKRGNPALAEAYNRNVQAILDWRIEHRSLVETSIKDFGDSHGTGKPPLTFLDDQIERTKRALIPPS